jgi:hypothetical protein
MAVLYAITKHDYATSKTFVLATNTDKQNARFDMESQASGYILKKDGETADLSWKVLHKKAFLKDRNTSGYGHFAVYSNNKVTIWKGFPILPEKSSSIISWFSSATPETKWEKIMSMFIVEFRQSDFIQTPEPKIEWSPKDNSGENAPVSPIDKEITERRAKFIRDFKKLNSVSSLHEDATPTTGLRFKYPEEFMSCPNATKFVELVPVSSQEPEQKQEAKQETESEKNFDSVFPPVELATEPVDVEAPAPESEPVSEPELEIDLEHKNTEE